MVMASPNTRNKAVLMYQEYEQKMKEMKMQFESSKQLESGSDNLYVDKKINNILVRHEMKNLTPVK